MNNTQHIKGLTQEEVEKQKSLGLSNEIVDSYTPTTLRIFQKNIFSLINIVLIPLLFALWYYQEYNDVLAFSTFAIINTVISIFDEQRIKKQLDNLKSHFQQTANVIRDSKSQNIPVNNIVEGDFVKAKEGEAIIADGTIVYSNYLQLDESALNGEANYITKDENDKVFSGSFIITGECIYEVKNVGKNNYLNKLGKEALKFKTKQSRLQSNGNKLIIFLVIASLVVGLLNFYFSGLNHIANAEKILSFTTIIVLIVPQTLIFLFTLTFSVSINKLYAKGILVQKGSSIEELSNIDVICFDKTGTITTNEMTLTDIRYFHVSESEIGKLYNSIQNRIVSVNKTQEVLNKKYQDFPKFDEIQSFDQIPFTSKNKYSLITAQVDNFKKTILFGAYSILKDNIDNTLKDEIKYFIEEQESKGNRVLLATYFNEPEKVEDEKTILIKEKTLNLKNTDYKKDKNLIVSTNLINKDNQISKTSNSSTTVLLNGKTTKQIIVYTIEEKLNPGIKDVLRRLKDQNIAVKIISGDSSTSVSKVLEKVGMHNNKPYDLSTLGNDNEIKEYVGIKEERKKLIDDLVSTTDVFTRAKPEDKLTIIKALQKKGFKVAMVGDGINDVLSLKSADVSISMESGAKIARDIADIVLLKNDYQKIPEIFYEGDNIIFNLKISTQMFLLRSIFSIIVAIYFTLNENSLPILPSSTLIFSFLGSSAPSYIIVFTRQRVFSKLGFFREILQSVIPTSILFSIVLVIFYKVIVNEGTYYIPINTTLIMLILSISIAYSVFLLWKAKKIKNVLLAAFLYIFTFIVGVFQTILPITDKSNSEKLALIFLMLIGSAILYLFFSKLNKLKTSKSKILLALACISIVPIASIFPFTTYYNVESLPIIAYIYIILTSIITLILIFIINRIVEILLIRVLDNKTL